MEFIKKHYKFILLLIFIMAMNVVVYLMGLDEIIETLGARNAYLISFLTAVFAGFSLFTSSIFYSAYIAIAASGLNFVFLGLISGIGLIISDSIFFYTAISGSRALPEKWQKKSQHFADKLEKKNKFLVPLIAFLYFMFAPIPNDVILTVLALARQKFKKIFPILIIGDIGFTIMIAYLTQQGVKWFWG